MTLQPQINLEKSLDKAQTSLATGLLTEAVSAVREALIHAPHSAEAWLLKARIDLARNDPKQALASLDAHDLNHPEHCDKPELALLRAESLCRAGLSEMAQNLLARIVADFPDDVRAHKLIAGVYQTLKEPHKAIEHLKQVLRLTPNDVLSQRMLIDLLEVTSPQDSAVMLQNLLNDQRDCGATQLRLARLYHKLGRGCDAENIYRQLLVTESKDASLWLEAGKLAMEMGASQLALTRLDQAGRLMGKDAGPVLTAKAVALMQMGRLAQAGMLWWQLYRKRGGEVEAAAGVLVCALALGRGRIVRMAHRQLAIHASRQERRKAVMRLWSKAAGGLVVARHLNTPMRVTLVEQGSLLGPILKQSVEKLAIQVSQYPQRADSHYHLAVCQAATGQARPAGESVMQALDINPRYSDAARLFAKLEADKRKVA